MRWMLAFLLVACSLSATAGADAINRAATDHAVINRGEYHFAVGPVPGFVEPVAIAEQWPAGAPGASGERWRNWLVDFQADYRHGRSIAYFDRAFEAVSPELIGNAAKFQIVFSPDYQALTLHSVEVRRDGQWSNRLVPEKVTLARRESDFEQDMSDGRVTALIVMDDIRPADVVRIRYSIEGSNPILAGQHSDQLSLAWPDPILDRTARLLFDADRDIAKVDLNNAATTPVSEKKLADGVELRVATHGVAAVRDEGNYPRWYSPFPELQLTPKRSWTDVVNWALPLYPEPGPLPADLEKRIAQWRLLPDPIARTAAALRAVQDEVRYFGVEMGDSSHRPSPPATTWTRRYGDCKDKAYLLAVILRRMDIAAEPALVSTDEGRTIKNYSPSAALFNHVIVRVRPGNQTFWVDATQTLQRGDLRNEDVDDFGYALPIVAGTAALAEVKRPADVHNEISVAEDYRPSSDGRTIALTVDTFYTGGPADQLRRTLANRGAGETSKQYADFYRKRFGDLDVVGDLAVQDDDGTDKLHLTEHYRLKEAWSRESEPELMLDVYADALADDAHLPQSISRSAPIALSYPMSLNHVARMELPADWRWLGDNEDKTISTPQFRYNRQFTQNGKVLSLSNHLDFLDDHVPLAGMDEYLHRMREVNEGLSRRFVVQMPGDPRQQDREQRLQKLLRDAMGK